MFIITIIRNIFCSVADGFPHTPFQVGLIDLLNLWDHILMNLSKGQAVGVPTALSPASPTRFRLRIFKTGDENTEHRTQEATTLWAEYSLYC